MPDLVHIVKLIDLLVEVGAGELLWPWAQVVILKVVRVIEVAVVGRWVITTTDVSIFRFRGLFLLVNDQRLLDLRVSRDHGLLRRRSWLILLFRGS